jgi:1,4-dihydroxy-2-naphthoate polyprenyltransferase
VTIRPWLKALRAHFLTATVAPVAVGTAAAWYAAGRFDPLVFILALVGCAFIHLGANMSNDYFDYRSETDALNANASAFSGGSRVIQDGLIPARSILVAAIVCFVIGAGIGLGLVIVQGNIPLLAAGLVGLFCAYFYTGAPLRLGYRGFAELLNGLSFGPVIVMGAFFAQTQQWSTAALLASIPPGVHLAALLAINEFPDHAADKAVGKKTIVVLLGKRRALLVYQAGLFLPFLWVAAFTVAGLFPAWSLLSMAAAPLALRAYAVSRDHYQDDAKLGPANRDTFLLHLSFSLLFALGLLLG